MVFVIQTRVSLILSLWTGRPGSLSTGPSHPQSKQVDEIEYRLLSEKIIDNKFVLVCLQLTSMTTAF